MRIEHMACVNVAGLNGKASFIEVLLQLLGVSQFKCATTLLHLGMISPAKVLLWRNCYSSAGKVILAVGNQLIPGSHLFGSDGGWGTQEGGCFCSDEK